MTTTAILSAKGGAGKTLISLQLAAASALAGYRTLAVDGDRLETLINAIACRPDDAVPIAAAAYSDGATLRQQVQLAKRTYDHIFIDCGGGPGSTTLRAAITVADQIILPVQPRSFDLWAIENLVEVVQEAGAVLDRLPPVYAVLSMADAKGADNAETIANLPQGVSYLPTHLVRRKALANAAGAGLSILEVPRPDPKALAEVRALADTVLAGVGAQQREAA